VSFDRSLMLWRVALRNVGAQRVKSAIVGSVFVLGTALVLIGNAVVDAMDAGMEHSVVDSLAGHLQIHSATSRDPLAIYGDEFAGMPDVGVMPDFAAVARVVRGVENVAAVIPMGSQYAFVAGGNDFDKQLSVLRDAVRDGDEEGVALGRARVRQMVVKLVADLDRAKVLSDGRVSERTVRIDKGRAAAEASFWSDFDAHRLEKLEYLENHVAPLQLDSSWLGVWFVGTDLDAFQAQFGRFRVVKGRAVPPGRRGYLFNDGLYEEQFKHLVARTLDMLLRKRREGQSIDSDAELRSERDTMVRQYRRVVFQLGPRDTTRVREGLREHLGRPTASLDELLQAFLKVDDENIEARHAWFYEHVAPVIDLHPIPVGGHITLRSFTQSGYARALKLPVYGTFTFEGLERASIAKQHNLIDLISFRDLHGYMTPERQAEIDAIRKESGVSDVAREGAEAALFGGEEALVEDARAEAAEPIAPPSIEVADLDLDRAFTRAEIERGLAQHAAVLLGDPSRLKETQAAVQAATDAAGLKLKVLDWKSAAGMVGQLVTLVRVVLFFVVLMLAVVALVVINNSMVMATMERVHEIGTMRAIGAQRGFVTRLFMAETLALGFLAGIVGGLLGAGVVLWMQRVGIPAPNEFATFLFSGERLHPQLSLTHVLAAVLNVVLVGVLSTWYPARIAARIPPADAMRET